ncbi:MAG: hypothetical protein ACREDK_05960 [Thermoplasmata archaeon]
MASRDLSWAEDRPLRRAAVVYDTQFEETHAVAEALARGIRRQNVATDVFTVAEAERAPLDAYSLLALGSPTELLSCTRGMRVFLSHLGRRNLKGRYGFAFDTKIRHHPGRAAEHIHATLEHFGFRMRVEPASAFVTVVESPGGHPSPAHEHPAHALETGMEDAFEKAGADLVQKIRGETEDVWEVAPTTTTPPTPKTGPEDPKRPKTRWPY